MNLITTLRWSGRILAALVVFLLTIDTLMAGLGQWDLTFLRQLYWAEYVLPLFVVTGALGLTYALHRERTGAIIALSCGALFTAMAVATMQVPRVWLVGMALAVPGALLLLARTLEKRRGGGEGRPGQDETVRSNQSMASTATSSSVPGSSNR